MEKFEPNIIFSYDIALQPLLQKALLFFFCFVD